MKNIVIPENEIIDIVYLLRSCAAGAAKDDNKYLAWYLRQKAMRFQDYLNEEKEAGI